MAWFILCCLLENLPQVTIQLPLRYVYFDKFAITFCNNSACIQFCCSYWQKMKVWPFCTAVYHCIGGSMAEALLYIGIFFRFDTQILRNLAMSGVGTTPPPARGWRPPTGNPGSATALLIQSSFYTRTLYDVPHPCYIPDKVIKLTEDFRCHKINNVM